ncbi:Hypothetical protein, putative [Bodo saltans]|uniref:Uncharacterized protein n=1 Tax=Bodo saltans TaxID=75058 RepID=A0A0S4JL72_BODSA|nr:Hypothetical protein, putative [Bodo saltans]|eukprot:CUG89802.1 Hypothetical protein, putative [Bodo saltans]
MDPNQPSASSFQYLLIPADATKAVSSTTFAGESDEQLRHTITQYFRSQASLSAGQRQELKSNIVARATANAEKHTVKKTENEELATTDSNASAAVALQGPSSAAAEDDTTAAAAAEQQASRMTSLAEDFVDQTSFEIVPVVMPTRKNRFIGTSLYIDDAGRFKELPVNTRASTVAQRDIRGDAFMLSNYDDPAVDEWKRVDTTPETYEELYKNPPQSQLDTSNQAAMSAATIHRENDAKRISVEDAAKGLEAKADGNKFFVGGDFKAGVQAYTHAIELLDGRRDLHANAAELEQTLVTSYVNRSLCQAKLNLWSESLLSARAAVELDPSNAKGYFRIASARAALKEFHEASLALQACELRGGSADDIARLRAEIAEGSKQFQAKQKATYSKMFA